MDGGNSVTDKMPWTTVNKEAVGLGLFLEPSENFVFFDGQVVAVVHDVFVEVLLVMECPAGKDNGGDECADHGALDILFLAVHRSGKVLDHVGDGEGCNKGHCREHHEAVALVDFDGEIARDVFENDVRLDVVQEQESENLEVGVVALSGVVDGAVGKVNCAYDEQVVEVAEERVYEVSVLVELQCHHVPVLGEVLEEVSVSFKFATLETEPLEVTDGEEYWHREKRKYNEERRGLCVFFVEQFREGKEDECENAEDCFLACLRKEGEDEGKENPMLYGVSIVCPLENEERKCREEYVKRFNGHGAELEQHCRLDCHEKRCQEREKRLLSPCDDCKEHEQERERQHHEFRGENPAEVCSEQRHAEIVKERKTFGFEAVGIVVAFQMVLIEFALVASS